MARSKPKSEQKEITGQDVTKYMFIALGVLIALGLVIAGSFELYFSIAKRGTGFPQPMVPEPKMPKSPLESVPVQNESVVVSQNETTTSLVDENVSNAAPLPEVQLNQTGESESENQTFNQTNQTVTLEVTNTAQNKTNTSQVVKYTFDQLSVIFPDTLNYIQNGKSSYHYINITEKDGTPILNSEGFDVDVIVKIGNGQPASIIPQYEKGGWLISLQLTPAGTHQMTVNVGCKKGVNYCSRIYSGTPKTAQQQFVVK